MLATVTDVGVIPVWSLKAAAGTGLFDAVAVATGLVVDEQAASVPVNMATATTSVDHRMTRRSPFVRQHM